MSEMNAEECQLGMEITTAEFWAIYRPEVAQALRAAHWLAAGAGRKAGGACAGAVRISGDGENVSQNPVGEEL